MFPNEIYKFAAGSPLGGDLVFQLPFLFLLNIFKKVIPFLNTQYLFYGLNLSVGYLAFIFMFRELSKKMLKIELEMISGLFYVFSNFTIFTLWNHQLNPMYLVSVFPLGIYLFVKALKTNQSIYSIILALLLSLFSILFMAVPWTLGAIIGLLPVVVYLIGKYGIVFLKQFIIFISLFCLLNLYWIFPFAYSIITGSGTSSDFVGSAINSNATENAGNIIKIVSGGNNLLFPLFNQFHTLVQPKSLIFSLMVIFPLIIISKLIFAKPNNYLHYFFLVSWAISLYLFTVIIFGESGLTFFLWLNQHIPGFNMFRFMYDKFGYALAITSSMLLFSSINVLERIKHKKIYFGAVISALLLILISSTSFIKGDLHRQPITGTTNTFYDITDFNEDYYGLINYLKTSTDESKIIWFPLNIAGYTPIRDRFLDNHYYFGISPLKYFTDREDIPGILALRKYQTAMIKAINDRDTEAILNILQDLNINHIILNKDINKEISTGYIYPDGLFGKQTNSQFLNQVLGEKIKDFGDKYSLFNIPEKYKSRKISIINTQNKEKRLIFAVNTISLLALIGSVAYLLACMTRNIYYLNRRN